MIPKFSWNKQHTQFAHIQRIRHRQCIQKTNSNPHHLGLILRIQPNRNLVNIPQFRLRQCKKLTLLLLMHRQTRDQNPLSSGMKLPPRNRRNNLLPRPLMQILNPILSPYQYPTRPICPPMQRRQTARRRMCSCRPSPTDMIQPQVQFIICDFLLDTLFRRCHTV